MVSLILTLFPPSFQVLVHIGFKMYACEKLLMHKTTKCHSEFSKSELNWLLWHQNFLNRQKSGTVYQIILDTAKKKIVKYIPFDNSLSKWAMQTMSSISSGVMQKLVCKTQKSKIPSYIVNLLECGENRMSDQLGNRWTGDTARFGIEPASVSLCLGLD